MTTGKPLKRLDKMWATNQLTMIYKENSLITGDCTDTLGQIPTEQIDLIYLDPPFFSQKEHILQSRDEAKIYRFEDKWQNLEEYLCFMRRVLNECRRVLKLTGSLFLHCDRYASHHLRVLLDHVFGEENFQSEIIWAYKRWSNTKKGLLNAHQNIYFYSKTADFNFNPIYADYSPTTNLDQLLQARERSKNGKSVYKRDANGQEVLAKEKKGVPLSDVWHIPLLNPKAQERVGYPTQKPVLLLKQIISLASHENDIVLDPFCGSGTSCVAARLLNRKYIGIDISAEAIALSTQRLAEMIVSDSAVLHKGEESYIEKSSSELALLDSLNAFPVQRNSGIDGFLKEYINGKPVPIKIQAPHESLQKAKEKLIQATRSSKYDIKMLVRTHELEEILLFPSHHHEDKIIVIDSLEMHIKNLRQQLKNTSPECF